MYLYFFIYRRTFGWSKGKYCGMTRIFIIRYAAYAGGMEYTIYVHTFIHSVGEFTTVCSEDSVVWRSVVVNTRALNLIP